MLFGLFVVYGLSGWVVMFWRWRRARHLLRQRAAGVSASDDDQPGQGE